MFIAVVAGLIAVAGLIGVLVVARRDTGPDEAGPPAAQPPVGPELTSPVTTMPAVDTGGAIRAIRALLGAVPNDPAYLGQVTVTDLDAATAAAGATRPPPGAAFDDPSTEAWVKDVWSDPNSPRPRGLPGILGGDIEGWRSELGFSLLDTSAAAMFTERATSGPSRPTKRLMVYDVDVDPATIDAAVRSDPIWSADLVDKQAGRTPYYFWTADGTPDMNRTTPARPLGVGGTMAVTDGLVIRADNENELIAALTVGVGGTLADRPEVSALLAGLEPYTPYELWLSNQSLPLLGVAAFPAPLRPLTLLASARTIIDGQRTTIVALAHTTANDASDNALLLQRNLTEGSLDGQPWSERFQSWTVTADGPLVLAVINEGHHKPADLLEIAQLLGFTPP